jgi:nitrite reductase/ring-hydroxylating ferredoxin subunit
MMNKLIVVITVFFLLVLSCKKDDDSQVPLVSVNLAFNLNNPEFINLQIDNGWTYVSGGSRGILLYRVSASNYKAFDRHCPYNPSSSCGLVSADVTNLVGIDDCCGSRFLLSSGQVTQGPASRPLKEYRTSYDGSTLSVFN